MNFDADTWVYATYYIPVTSDVHESMRFAKIRIPSHCIHLTNRIEPNEKDIWKKIETEPNEPPENFE